MEKQPPSLFGALRPYRALIAPLVLFAVASNLLTLVIPRITSKGIDLFVKTHAFPASVGWEFSAVMIAIFILAVLQGVLQTYASERVARDMRAELVAKISKKTFAAVQEANPSKLLTTLTSDIDSVKTFVSQALVSIVSSLFTVIGGGVFLMTLNVRLGLVVFAIVPIIGFTFFFIFARVRALFMKSREVIDWLNRVINESILGAPLIRVLHAEALERKKFIAANTDARNTGLSILGLFSIMIPIVTLVSNVATLAIVVLGGHYVILGEMTLGEFAAFQSYVVLIIFPIFVLGFMSNLVAQSQASYARVSAVLSLPDEKPSGSLAAELTGELALDHATLIYGDKSVLKDVSIEVKPGTRTAIIGPTAAGKSQLLWVLTGLVKPTSGAVRYDGKALQEYDPESFHTQVGLVFQDSSVLNATLEENIAFTKSVTKEDMELAIETAELKDFLSTLPDGLKTVVSERGTTLSGGQKQRIMLARALALKPKILFLDDFTARVDAKTEGRILSNVKKNYPSVTLISVTQKISTVQDYDQIILLMEGELLASGTHDELLKTSPEYAQLFESQLSTSQYEVHAEF